MFGKTAWLSRQGKKTILVKTDTECTGSRVTLCPHPTISRVALLGKQNYPKSNLELGASSHFSHTAGNLWREREQLSQASGNFRVREMTLLAGFHQFLKIVGRSFPLWNSLIVSESRIS
jgi:hypothetical protein